MRRRCSPRLTLVGLLVWCLVRLDGDNARVRGIPGDVKHHELSGAHPEMSGDECFGSWARYLGHREEELG